MKKYIKGLVHVLIASCLTLSATNSNAQNKDVEKGKATLAKAFEQNDPQKKMELIQKADELFSNGGLKREKYIIIGDAFLERNDLVQAANYYNRADKKDKLEGLKRVADAYSDQAFDATDAKAEAKSLKSAINFYNKSGALQEGASGIGDRFFEKGEASYNRALEYYFLAKDTPSAEKVANSMIAEGGESADKAIDVLVLIGSKNALKKAGDLSFAKNLYEKALDFYKQANYTEGMRKCAEKFNELGKIAEAQNVYVKITENYRNTGNTDAIEKLATDNVNAMNYELASKIYDKAGRQDLANKYYAYYKFMELDLDSAKLLLNAIGETDLVAAIDANKRPLENLRAAQATLKDFAEQQPPVSMENDPATGKLRPAAKDESILIDYYKGIKDVIVETFHGVSKNVLALSHPELKRLLIKRFKEYPAANKVLDPTFNIRLVKATSQVKDVYLK